MSYTHIESIIFTPGGGLTKSQVCFAFNVSISICIGIIHRSGSVAIACRYEWGILCSAFVSVRQAMELSCSMESRSNAYDAYGCFGPVAQSCPSLRPSCSRRWYSLDCRDEFEGWVTRVDFRGSTTVTGIE